MWCWLDGIMEHTHTHRNSCTLRWLALLKEPASFPPHSLSLLHLPILSVFLCSVGPAQWGDSLLSPARSSPLYFHFTICCFCCTLVYFWLLLFLVSSLSVSLLGLVSISHLLGWLLSRLYHVHSSSSFSPRHTLSPAPCALLPFGIFSPDVFFFSFSPHPFLCLNDWLSSILHHPLPVSIFYSPPFCDCIFFFFFLLLISLLIYSTVLSCGS